MIWQAGWPENLEAARLADEAGLEFILPIARWMGYGGQTDRQGTSFESLSWAAALLACTEEIVAFSTICVYPFAPVAFGGSLEDDPLGPPGEYAMSCVGRERIFRYFSQQTRSPGALVRLSYAIEWPRSCRGTRGIPTSTAGSSSRRIS